MKRFVFAVWLAASAAGLPVAALAAEPEKNEASGTGEGNLKIWEWANFALFAAGLGYLIRKYAGPFYAARAAGIRKDLEDSERATKDAEARIAEVERRLANLDAEIAALRAEGQRESAAEVERYARQTAAEIAKVGVNGEQEIAAAQKTARLELRRYAAQLALNLAERKVRDRMDSASETSLVSAFVEGLQPPASRN